MVPNAITLKSDYLTFCNIIENLINCSKEKQDAILHQNWRDLSCLTEKQDEIKRTLTTEEQYLSSIPVESLDEEFIKIKKDIKTKISEFQEIEKINVKLLKDAYFLAKSKVSTFFSKVSDTESYNHNKKKEEKLISKQPVMFDRFV